MKETQHAGLAFDVNSSLISIELAPEAAHMFPLVAGRLRRLVRYQESIMLLDNICLFLLPATPFSGAQATARRVSLLLADLPCELQVYHGMTALLVLQDLYGANVELTASNVPASSEKAGRATHQKGRASRIKEPARSPLPYLAFLENYPSPRLLELFPYDMARRYQCVPIGTEQNMLTLATCHWLNREVIAQLHANIHLEIFQVRCEMVIIDEVLRYWQHIQEAREVTTGGAAQNVVVGSCSR